MTQIRRVETKHTGLPGAPYLSVFYFSFVAGQAEAAGAAVHTFWESLRAHMDNANTATVQAEQKIIEDTTGQTMSVEVDPSVGIPSVGTSTGGPNSPQTQGLIRLSTATFVNGRRLQGRIFIPATTQVQGDLAPVAAYQTALGTHATTLAGGAGTYGSLRVWSRPRDAVPQWTDAKGVVHAAKPAHVGISDVVTSAIAWSKWATLRSRRD